MIIANQVTQEYFHGEHTSKCTRLYSTYELVDDSVPEKKHRIKLTQLWNRKTCEVEVWSERDLQWNAVTSYKSKWPESKWRYACWGTPLNPDLDYSYGHAGDPPEGKGKHKLKIHNRFVIEQDRRIAYDVERATLKQACWVLFNDDHFKVIDAESGVRLVIE